MPTLIEQIVEHASRVPEGTPISAKDFLHLGNRAAVDKALSRLATRRRLLRAGRGTYIGPVLNETGNRAPTTASVISGLVAQRGETIVVYGAAAANRLGLTRQVPVREIYLTSGRSRCLDVGAEVVELRHAPAWQLVLPGTTAGDVIRALAWLGPQKAVRAIDRLRKKLGSSDIQELATIRARMPAWVADVVSQLMRKKSSR